MASTLTPEAQAEKIAKLLRKAESTTPAEAEALMDKAQELMQKWAIDAAMLAAAQGDLEQVTEQIVQKSIFIKGIYSKALMTLAFNIGTACDCKGVYSDWRPGINVTITGFESDVDRVLLLFASLDLQCARAMRAWWKDQPDDYWTKKNGYKMRREFIYGFAQGIAQRFREVNATAQKQAAQEHAEETHVSEEEAATSVALVLRSRKEQVKDWYDNHYGSSLRSVTSRRGYGGADASGAGAAAGRSANISTGAGVGRSSAGALGA